MELVHKCAPARVTSSALAVTPRDVRYNLIARCLDIIKSELARSASVCDGKVSPCLIELWVLR